MTNHIIFKGTKNEITESLKTILSATYRVKLNQIKEGC